MSKARFTFTKALFFVAILGIFVGILLPPIMQRIKYVRWRGFNTSMNYDPYTVINYNFDNPGFKANYKGELMSALHNNATGSDAPDFFPGDYNGILRNNTEWRKAGRWGINYALQFDGRSSFVEIPVSKSIDFDQSKDDFSVAFWVSLDTIKGTAQTFFSKSAWPFTTQYDMYYLRGRIEADVGNSTAAWPCPQIAPFEWVNIVLTSESGRLKLYINGKLSTVKTKINTAMLPFSKTDNKLLIGTAGFANRQTGYFLHGRMDEFMLFRKALSLKEIEMIYQMGKPPLTGRFE